MSDSTATLSPVTVTAKRAPPDDVTLIVRGLAWGGWMDVRITRGIERLPSDFDVQLTEFAPGQGDVEILRGDSCVVKLGDDVVLTGYVDRIIRTLDKGRHTVTITGRSKCSDLVDCAAEWPGGLIAGNSVLEVAQKLVLPYSDGSIKVTCVGDPGPKIPRVNLIRGETPFELIERFCRFGQLLAYDTPKGDLLLTSLSETRTASGFQEGVNVIRAQYAATLDQRYSVIECFLQSVERISDLGEGGDLRAQVVDLGVPRHRRQVLICETSGGIGQEIAQQRAGWESRRASGRSDQVFLTTDSWRDADGDLYAPNTLALLNLPTLKVGPTIWTIGEVTYRRGEGGTTCDVMLMPGDAFKPQPFNLYQLLPFAEAAEIAQKVNP